MDEMQESWSALIIFGGTGCILILIGLVVAMITKKKNEACTVRTVGKVAKHDFRSSDGVKPIVEFKADGKTYKTTKKYNGVKSWHNGFSNAEARIWEDEKNYLCIKTGAFADWRQLAEDLWPLGSDIIVYYDPTDPERNYVDRPITNRFILIMFVGMGILFMALGILMFFLMQLGQ